MCRIESRFVKALLYTPNKASKKTHFPFSFLRSVPPHADEYQIPMKAFRCMHTRRAPAQPPEEVVAVCIAVVGLYSGCCIFDWGLVGACLLLLLALLRSLATYLILPLNPLWEGD